MKYFFNKQAIKESVLDEWQIEGLLLWCQLTHDLRVTHYKAFSVYMCSCGKQWWTE